MRRLGLLVLMIGIWTCSDSGPTAPKVQLPTVQNIEFTLEEDTSKTFAFMGSDPLSRALTYSVSTQPQHGTITINAGAGTYTPNANYHGADSFAYIATNVDGSSNIGTIVATITPVDDEPSTMDVSATTDEDNSVTLTLEAEEYDGENIEFQVRNNPSNGSVTISGNTATYIPNENWYGTDTFNFEAVDSSARSILNTATATITVNPVNDVPIVEDISDIQALTNSSTEINLIGSDIEGEELTFSIVGPPSKGTVTVNGSIATYVANSPGEDSFTYKANDGTQDSEVANVNIEVNLKPVIIEDENVASFIKKTFEVADGFLLAIHSVSSAGSNYISLAKINFDGELQWYKELNGGATGGANINLYNGYEIDGEYFLSAWSTDSSNRYNTYINKIDEQGNLEWENTYHYSNSRYFLPSDIDRYDQNNLILTADRNQGSSLILIDNNGNFITEISEYYASQTKFLLKDKDNNNNITIGPSATGSGDRINIYTTSHDFKTEISYQYVKNGCSNSMSWRQDKEAIRTSDDMFLLTGFFCDNYGVAKINPNNGNMEWFIPMPKPISSENVRIIEDLNQDYLIAGMDYSDNDEKYNITVQKIDSDGNQIWYKIYETNFRDFVADIISISDGGYLIGGSTSINGLSGMVIKLDSSGERIF